MRNLYKLGLIGLLVIPAIASAHGPSRLKVNKDIQIDASPAEVWDVISEFCSIEAWHPAIEKCELGGDGGNKKGTTRTLTLGNGESFTESLLSHNADGMTYSYRITEPNHDAVPVGSYGSTITVSEGEDGGANLNWKGFFYRAYPNNDPPPELSDEAALEAVNGIYDSGMARIKELAEN